ncbi:hypothetical protein SDC49_07305 [Lactobacillus sp. R2/2]|nr:hypothetical protein [Lactobacillus sp. R2/2]
MSIADNKWGDTINQRYSAAKAMGFHNQLLMLLPKRLMMQLLTTRKLVIS